MVRWEGVDLPILRYGREAILVLRILRTRGLCDGVYYVGRIRMRQLRRVTISRVLLLLPNRQRSKVIRVPFLLYILFVILDLFWVYILILLFLRRLILGSELPIVRVPAMTGVPIVPCPDLTRSRVYISIVVSPVHFAFKVNSTEHRSQAPSQVQSCSQTDRRGCSLLNIIACRRYLVSLVGSFLIDGQWIRLLAQKYSLLSPQGRSLWSDPRQY